MPCPRCNSAKGSLLDFACFTAGGGGGGDDSGGDDGDDGDGNGGKGGELSLMNTRFCFRRNARGLKKI